jgi:hypothetical protein
MKYKIPNFNLFLKESKPWGLKKVYFNRKWHHNYDGYEHQRTNPDYKKLASILGMKKSESVLFLAGHKGTWSLALAKAGLRVTYSELSKEIKNWVQKNVKHKNIVNCIQANYVLMPSKILEYDWSFTFEAVGPKEFIILRSLLNKKGGKYVVWNKSKHVRDKIKNIVKTIKLCEKLYNAKFKKQTKNILSKDRNMENKLRNHTVLTIITNEYARRAIKEDFDLLAILKNKRKTNISWLTKKVGKSEQQINNSFKRLQKWAGLFESRYKKEITIDQI